MENFHTHTYRCGHARGDVADYAREALQGGAKILGMSDHCPLPDGLWDHVRMEFHELEDYFAAIEEARRSFPELILLKGLEAEWVPSLRTYLEEEILGRQAVEYLVGGTHWVPFRGDWLPMSQLDSAEKLRAYSAHLVGAMETGLYAFIAHPDGFGMTPAIWDADRAACTRDICEAAKSLKIPLEINGYGMRKPKIETPEGERLKYPWKPFWEVAAEYDLTVVCNSDAHNPENVLANIREGEALAADLGLKLANLSQRISALAA